MQANARSSRLRAERHRALTFGVLLWLQCLVASCRQDNSRPGRPNRFWLDDDGILRLQFTSTQVDGTQQAEPPFGEQLARALTTAGIPFERHQSVLRCRRLLAGRSLLPDRSLATRGLTHTTYRFTLDPLLPGFQGKLEQVVIQILADQRDRDRCQARMGSRQHSASRLN